MKTQNTFQLQNYCTPPPSKKKKKVSDERGNKMKMKENDCGKAGAEEEEMEMGWK